MKLLLQPENSSLCGHCCVAMAANIPLRRAIDLIGHEKGTTTGELVFVLNMLGIRCASKLRRVSRTKPLLPRRAIVAIHTRGNRRGHWMLTWDGEMFDPGGGWPGGYKDWRITSYLEIYD